MSQKFLTNVELEAGLVDGSNSSGTSGFLLSSTGTATSWVDPAAVFVGESEQVHIACKNTSGVAISKGDPVYITGTVGTSFKIEIAKADASDSAKMPAVGLAETDLGLNAEGFVIVSGVLKNLTTDPLSTSDGTPSSNDTVYVKAGGGLTRTKPTGSGNLIQNVGKVGRVSSANSGSLAVSTIMRTNDVPNLTTGKIWVGSPTYTTESTVVHLDETNGRMGIGTTSPVQKLDVAGDGRFQGRVYTNATALASVGILGKAIANGWAARYDSNNANYSGFYFDTNNDASMILRDDAGNMNVYLRSDSTSYLNGGNVGIGTTSPAGPLTIANANNGNWNDGLIIDDPTGWAATVYKRSNVPKMFTGLYSGNDNYIWMSTGYNNAGTTITAPRTDAVLMARPGTDDLQIYLDTHFGGNVGIGTTSPDSLLHLSASAPTLKLQSSADTNSSISFDNSSGTQRAFLSFSESTDNLTLRNVTGTGNLSFTGSTGQCEFTTGTAAQTGVVLNYQSLALKSNYSTVLYANSLNQVGIGTTTPSEKLFVNGGNIKAKNTGTVYLKLNSNTIYPSVQIQAERQGGTSPPMGQLRWDSNPGAFGMQLHFWNSYTENSLKLDGSNFRVTNNGSETMRITSTGNVGIGTTSPGEKLEVDGTVKATAATDAYKGYIKNTITCTPLMKSANTSYNYIPYNTTIFGSTPDYFNRMVAPYDGRVKKIILRHISGTTPTATGMKFKKEVNGTVSTTEYTATVTGGASASFTAIYDFANSDFTFSEGDSIGILAQTSGGTGNIGGASAQIIVEYNIT